MNRPMLHCVCPTVVRVLIAAAACTPAIAFGQVRTRPTRNAVVTLHRVSDRAPVQGWPGLTNIFFAPVPSSMRTEARFGEQWSAIEVADVVMGDGLRTIYAARYKMPGSDELHYVVDTAGRLDFVHARPLDFEQQVHVHKLVREQRVVLIGKTSFKLRSSCGGIDLVIHGH